MKQKPTIGQWLGWDGFSSFDRSAVLRLWNDVNNCKNGEYTHYFRAFIKAEPHKRSKILENRWRLIMCASLPMQVLWRMALKHQNDWLNDHPYDCPSAHGLVFNYGGWRRFKRELEARGLRYSRDISAWDVNMPGWIIHLVKEFRKRAGGPSDWLVTMDLLYADAFDQAQILFSNGFVVQQKFSGVMKSGLYVTIADNSLGVVGMHVIASFRSRQPVGHVWVTGDDALHSHMSDSYLEELEKLGCKVKEWIEKPIFMGTDFTTSPIPMYFEKHVANFWINVDNVEERLDAYARLWSHDDRVFAFWKRVAASKGIDLKSQRYYQFWYDSPMAKMINKM